MIRKRQGVLNLLSSQEEPNWLPIDQFFTMVAEPAKSIAVKAAQLQLAQFRAVILSLFPVEEHQHLYGTFTQSYHNAFAYSVGHRRELTDVTEDIDIFCFVELLMVAHQPTAVDKPQFMPIGVAEGVLVVDAEAKVREAKMLWHKGTPDKLKQSKSFTQKIIVDKREKVH